MMIRLGLFDDHDIVRAGFRHLLSEQDDIELAAEGATGRDALQAVRDGALDVCIVDVNLPDLSGLDVLRLAKGHRPGPALLLLSGHSEEQYGLNALKAGAAGYLSKAQAGEQLVAAIRTVAGGRRYVSPRLGELLAAGLTEDVDLPRHLKLSEREFQIFRRLAGGQSVTEIASHLCLSTKTVSTYRSRVLDKMGLGSNAELAQYAVRHALL